MKEVWKRIEQYPYYYVSDLGRVKSSFHNKETILSPRLDWNGRLFVNLYDGKGNMHSVKIHRLVAKAFIPNPLNLPQINHKDENPKNNRVSNLEWCTAKYNLTYNKLQKRQHAVQKRKIGAFNKEMQLVHCFPSGTEAAEYIVSIGLSNTFRSAVGNICYNAKTEKTKMNYGFLWRYLEPSHRKDG